MRYLVAPPTPGDRPDDFAHTMPGEVLALGVECDRPGCGCDRAFIGTSSLRGTTTGVVLDVVLDEAAVARLVRQAVARTLGLTPGAIKQAEAIEAVRIVSGALIDRQPGDVIRVADLNLAEVGA